MVHDSRLNVVPLLEIEHCEFPDELHYDLENLVWVRLNEKEATAGITSVHVAVSGRLKEIRFKPVQTVLARGQSFATIESSRYFGSVRTPLSGRIITENTALESNPKLANDSPYGDGWFVVIDPSDLQREMTALAQPKQLEARIRSQIRELRVRCFQAYPDYEMWEIGVECAAVLVRLNELMERMSVNEVVHVVSDDPTADIEIERWSDQSGQAVLESRKEGRLAQLS